MPTLNWIGKEAVINHHDEVPIHTLTLDRDRSLGYANEPLGTGNLLVEGDNLTALKALLPYYAGKVKCIFIDPPYNTGNESWIYNDNVNDPTIKKWLGKTVGSLAVDLSRHDKWLCMMYPRLCLLHQFLREDGVIFISIDDNEQSNLRLLMNEIFNEANFIACLPTVMNLKGNNDEFGFAGTHEYTLCWAKNKERAQIGEFELEDEELLDSWLEDDYGYYKKGAGLKATGQNAPRDKRPNLYYPIFVGPQNEVTVMESTQTQSYEKVLPITDGEEMSWRWQKKTLAARIYDLIVERTNSGITLYKKQRPSLGDLPTKKPKSLLYKPAYSSGNGTTILKKIFGKKVFNNPKPVQLLKDLIYLTTKDDDIVLDSFAGSGTIGHAVLAQNREDGGNRRFILVELKKEIARDITAVRLQRVIEGYTSKQEGSLQPLFGKDKETFAYYSVGETFLDRQEIPFHEMAQYLFFKETGSPIEVDTVRALMEGDSPSYATCTTPERYQRAFLGSVEGVGVYLLNNDDVLNDELIDRLPRHEGRRIIHCGGTQLSIGLLKDRGITFRQMPYNLV
ncbi:site-specific DNA-methyltransferase [Candidatus Poribacteria bacterium]|nr:site-specific DNA-methyltransferase [Candidatus Poribacteria bacterium]